jgi:hypothetical protein
VTRILSTKRFRSFEIKSFESPFQEQVRRLFRVLDWMLAIPSELEQSFRSEVERFEEARRMPYVTSIERLAREEGRQEGRLRGHKTGRQEGRQEGHKTGRKEGLAAGYQAAILELLKLKFKKVGAKHSRKVRSVRELPRLQVLLRAASDADSLAEALSLIQDR